MKAMTALQLGAIALKLIPDLVHSIGESVEAWQASGDEKAPIEEKIKEATEAGQAWFDMAANQLPQAMNLKALQTFRNETIPAFASFLFRLADGGNDGAE